MPISVGDRLLNRYKLETVIGEGGTSVVYKAVDLTEAQEVAVKVLKTQAISRRTEDLIRFRREATAISRLQHAHLVHVHAVGEFQEIPFLVLEYFPGISLEVLLRQQPVQPLPTIIRWMQQLSEVLDYMHTHGILHRNLKPGTILALDTTVKLLDFGLAQVVDWSRLEDPGVISDTFSYLSPEQTGLVRKPVDERSDLYSLGILFYRLLARELPFAAKDLSDLLHQQIAMQPRPLRQVNADVPVILEEMVLRLLQKDPEARYQSARGLLADLNKFAGGSSTFILGQEDRLKKINYRTRLIGREAEMEKLKDFYTRAEQGQAGVCLISGEAGQGKSRLADEFGRYVFERRGWWVGGHCFDQTHKHPYQPFVEALDDYLRLLDQQPPELRAAMVQNLKQQTGELGEALCRLNPAVRAVLGDTPPLVPLEPEKENRRFLTLCSRVFRHLGAPEHPLVLMVDDWQWADEGSLSLLAEIVDDLQGEHVFLLGTYRDNEVSPDHRLVKIIMAAQAKLRPVECLSLPSLGVPAVNRLVSEMLQEDEAKLLPVSEYVFHHTAGNAFFTIEVVRQLVREKILEYRESGWTVQWESLRTRAIPKTILDIILARLDLLDHAEIELLSTAAVIGRKFTVKLLFSLSDLPEETVVAIVDNCTELQFLEWEYKSGNILFVHDRVKEAFYQRIEPQKKKKLHLQIARALEASSGPGAERPLFDLARHYSEAGEDAKALDYILPAAAKAHAEFANEAAMQYYHQGLAVLERLGQHGGPAWLRAKEGLIDVCNTLGRGDDIIALATEVMPYKQTPLEKAWLFRRMGSAYFKKGEMGACEKYIVQGLALLGEKMPLTPWKLGLALLWEVFRFVARTPWRWLYLLKRTRPERAENVEITRMYEKLSWNYVLSDIVKFLFTTTRVLNLTEVRMGKSRETAAALAMHGSLCMALGLFKRSLVYLNASLNMRRSVHDEEGIGQSLQLLGFCYCWHADYPRARVAAQQSADQFRRVEDMWELSMTLNALGQSFYYYGDYRQALAVYTEYDGIVRKNEDQHSICQGDLYFTAIYQEKGDYELAEKYAREGLELSEKLEIGFVVCVALIMLGNIRMEQQQWREGRAYLERAKALNERNNFMKNYTVNIYSSLAEAWLDEYAQAGKECGPETLRTIRAAVRDALRTTRGWAAYHGAALREAAKFFAWQGKLNKADQYFRAAIRQLERKGRRFELAKALAAYGRLLQTRGRPHEALQLMQRAYALFQEIGAQTHVTRLAEQLRAETAAPEALQDRLQEKVELMSIINAGHYLSSILDLDVLLEKIMDICLSLTGAERGYLFLYPEDPKAERNLQLKVACNVHKADFKQDEYAVSHTVVHQVEQLRKAVAVTDAGSDESLNREQNVVKYGLRSILGLPLLVKERCLGLVYLDNRLISGLFTEEKIDVLKILINQAAIAIENARLYLELQGKTRMEEELRLGREIQKKLLPRKIPSGLGLRLEGFMEAAREIGGDYYDFIPREGGKLLVVIGDVTGKGVSAGLVMSAAKAIIHGLSQQRELGPRELLLGANQVLSDYLEGKKFMTMLCLEWDPQRKSIRYSNAGHEPLILCRQAGSGPASAELQKPGGIFLGYDGDDLEKHFVEHELAVAAGDKILLYSDGATDALNSQEQRYSVEFLRGSVQRHAAKPLPAFLAAIKQELYDFIAGQEPFDDITLVALEVE